MLIECSSCPVRHRACDDCAMGALLAMPPAGAAAAFEVGLDGAERRTVGLFLALGLVSPAEAAEAVAIVEPAALAV